MASCNLCTRDNLKLYKGMYYDYRVYVCKQCALAYAVETNKEKEWTSR